MINASESLLELDSVLYKFRKRLRPANVGCASMKLEHLHRYEQGSLYAHRVRRVAAELQKYVETYTERLALTQIANVVRGLSAVGHRLPPELLVQLAAGVLADGGAALRMAPDVDVRDLFFGFSGQGFTNPLFWSRLSAAVLPRLPSFNPNTLPALAIALHAVGQLPPPPPSPAGPSSASSPSSPSSAAAALAVEVVRLLGASLERLQPARLADAAQVLAVVAPQLGLEVPEEVLGRMQAAALAALPSLSARPHQLTGLLLSLQQLQQQQRLPPPSALPPSDTTSTASTPGTAASPPAIQHPARPAPLSADILAAAAPHLLAAAPTMQLLHIKRAVQALAPSISAAAASSPSAAEAATASTALLVNLLGLLARRAAALLPAGAARADSSSASSSSAALLPSPGQLSRLPRGGQGVGLVLASMAGTAHSRVLDDGLLGLLEGLARAYAAALAPLAGGAATGEEQQPGSGSELRRLVGDADVGDLFTRVAALAVAGGEMGVLREDQRVSLARSLRVLGAADETVSGLLVGAVSG